MWLLTAHKPGFQDSCLHLQDDESGELDFELEASGVLWGRVRDAETSAAVEIDQLDLCRLERYEDGRVATLG